MSAQPLLFYQGKYDQLLQELNAVQDPSLQESHNIHVLNYLQSGENILPFLQKTLSSIEPSHPSWALLKYHTGLLQFIYGQNDEVKQIIESLRNNVESPLLQLCVCLLDVELAIRTGSECQLSLDFLQEKCSNVETFLAPTKVVDPAFIGRLSSLVKFAPLRVTMTKATNEQRTATLQSLTISRDAKTRPILPLPQVLPMAYAALSLVNYEKFSTILDSAEDPNNFAVLNNKGIYELYSHRYSSALLHFSKALDARHNKALVYPFHKIVYNIGLSLLMKQHPKKAFMMLHSIIPLMGHSPYLWLRLAESCIAYYKQRVVKLRRAHQVSPLISKKLVAANRTLYVLPLSDYRLFERYRDPQLPELDLQFADNCARNAVNLGNNEVKRAAQLISAFIALELNNGLRAVQMGKQVCSSPSNSDSQTQFLAKIYAAQGYCLTGNDGEASRLLSRLLIENLRKEKELYTVHYLTFARVHMVSHDMKKMQTQISKALEQEPNRTEVVLTKIAAELKARRLQQALELLNGYSEQ